MNLSFTAVFFLSFVVVGAIPAVNANIVNDVVTTVSSSSSDLLNWMTEHLLVDDDDDDVKLYAPQFFTWMNEHSKTYATKEETKLRFQIWKDNDAFIEAHNSKQPPSSYSVGHNPFSDLTHDEYRKMNKLGEYSPGLVTPVVRQQQQQQSKSSDDDENVILATTTKKATLRSSRRRRRTAEDAATIPDAVDWVEKGAIVPVKNQGMCGSCWAFSAIVAIEGAHYLDTGNLTSLSEQELVDCDKTDLGCGGGLMDNAFLFDENSTGLCSEQEYPYVMHRHWLQGCLADKDKDGHCTPVNHTRVETFYDVDNTVDALVAAIAQQPVSVAIEADQQSFQFYKSGVYDDPECGEMLDHGVAAVGYGTLEDDGNGNGPQEYFKVRNSWGPSWGDEGYILMSRSIQQNVNGTCGILGFASVPKLRDDFD